MTVHHNKKRFAQICATEPVACSQGKLLIVDDEDLVLQAFRRVVTMGIPGTVVDLASNGVEAVEHFKHEHPSVIIMDLLMPIMDGEHAFHEITDLCHRLNWQMPSVIFCTGYVPPDSILNLVAAHSQHVLLQKPVGNKTLISTLSDRLAA